MTSSKHTNTSSNRQQACMKQQCHMVAVAAIDKQPELIDNPTVFYREVIKFLNVS